MTLSPHAVISELEPVAADLLERHLSTTKEWFPHELVPWSEARDFEPGWTWSEEETAIPPAVRSALFVNLLTEDNLPYYSMEILGMFGGDDAWGEWGRRWTAEEGRHSIVIRDWLTIVRALDPVALERARMSQVSGGIVPHPNLPTLGMAYVTLQELATRLAHHNTGKLLEGTAGYAVMKRVAADENLHYLFYRDLSTAAIERFPSEMVIAIDDVVRNFAMPGTGIPGFVGHAKEIAAAGIYDFAVHHDSILVPVVLRHWKVEELTGLTDEAEQARDRVLHHIGRVGKAARRQKDRRASRRLTAANA